ncbi:MAG: isoleucine--tRNA ligase [Candidatus Bathyarchaeia archaeon]
MRKLKNHYNPVEIEEEVLRWWRKESVEKRIEAARKDGPLFRFLEGPPTTNGLMHIGHARGRAMKDVVLRFRTMQGYDVWRRAGWDCQGLPVEIEVEKKLGLGSKRDIERIGFQRFVEECNKLVDFYISSWRENSERLGLWLDYDNAYQTRRDEYIETVWWALKRAFDKGLLKEDFKVVPTCPRCETPLSSHEVAQGYTSVKDPSIYVKFPLEGREGEYILIWTTTPWTLPGDEAVSVNPDFDYARVKVSGETWILALELVDRVMTQLGVEKYEIVETVKGRTLVGLRYRHPLLEETPTHREHVTPPDHTIVCGAHVTLEEGTGCVHTAPAHGPEDFEIGRETGLTLFCPVDQRGCFKEEAGKYAGKFVKAADQEIISDLRAKGLLVWSGEIEHEYPLCWRCESPLIYRVDRQWFIRVDSIRRRMIEENAKVNWVPEWAGKSRFGEWLANAEDWCISRSRVWGTPLNIWRCVGCQKVVAVGSRAELEKLAFRLPERLELHRPWIDEVVLRCEVCGGEMRRTPYVLDVWLDSGMAHAAAVNYPKDKSLFEKLYPYDFVTEAVDQTRGWFYSLLATGVLLFDKAPYRSVLCQGHVVDKYEQKMSKSKGNVVWANETLEKYGADLIRIYLLMKAPPEDTLIFDPDDLEQIKRVMSVLWNVFVFTITYMLLDNFKPEAWPLEAVEAYLENEDRWLLSRCQSVQREVTTSLESLRLHKAVRSLLNFVTEDISRFYIRLIRRRTWIEAEEMGKTAAYATLYYALSVAVKLMAPIAPYVTEELYHALTGDTNSVHSCTWPPFNEKLFDARLEKYMDITREAVKAALAARQRGKMKVRWPIRKVTIVPSSSEAEEALRRQANILANQINAKEVEVQKPGSIPPFIEIVIEPRYERLGPRFKGRVSEVSEALRQMGGKLEKRVEELTLNVGGEEVKLTSEDFAVKESLPKHVVSESFSYGIVYIDITLTRELLAEALAKEIVRRAQVMRKEMQLKIEEYVNLTLQPQEQEIVELLEIMREYITREVRVRSLQITPPEGEVAVPSGSYVKEWEIWDEIVKIILQRVD